MEKNLFRVGVAQLTSTNDKEFNFKNCLQLVEKAHQQGIKFLNFPECFAYM